MKKVLISTFVVLLLVSGCGKVPKLENGQDAVVTLKGGNISVDDLYKEIKPEEKLNILINMIDRQILDKLYESNDDEKDYVETQMETVNFYYENYYKEQYNSLLDYIKSQGFENEDELKEFFALNYKREKATEAYAKDLITEKEIKKYYQDEIYGDITTSHILVTADYQEGSSEEVIKNAEKKALEEANSIIKKLKEGKDFSELAKELSDDSSSKASGGAIPAFNKGQQTEEYEKAALKLKLNEYSTTPVKDKYGYHIILKTAQADKPSLEDVKDDIIDQLSGEKMEADTNIQAKALIELREKYNIKIQDDELKKKYDAYVENIKK